MTKATRRRFFAIAAAPAAAALPAIATPVVEMHAADIAPVPLAKSDIIWWMSETCGLKVGDTITIDVSRSRREYRIVGSVTSNG